MKKKLLSQSFLRGFIYVLTLGLVAIPVKARTAKSRTYNDYLVLGSDGIAHDLEMFLSDSAKCAEAYKDKCAKR